MELVIAVVTVRDVRRVLCSLVMAESVILVVSWVVVVGDVLGRVLDILVVVVAWSVVVAVFTLEIVVVVGRRSVMDWRVVSGRAVVVHGLLEDGLKGHLVGSECIAGSLGLEANHASGKDRSGEFHSLN